MGHDPPQPLLVPGAWELFQLWCSLQRSVLVRCALLGAQGPRHVCSGHALQNLGQEAGTRLRGLVSPVRLPPEENVAGPESPREVVGVATGQQARLAQVDLRRWAWRELTLSGPVRTHGQAQDALDSGRSSQIRHGFPHWLSRALPFLTQLNPIQLGSQLLSFLPRTLAYAPVSTPASTLSARVGL